MGSRVYNVLVVVFWFSTLLWLLIAKVAPELRRGEPPDYWSVERHRGLDEPAVCWDIFLGDQRVGSAASKVVALPESETELRSRIELPNFSLRRFRDSLLTTWLTQALLGSRSFDFRLDSRIWLDRAGHFRGIEASAFVDDMTAPFLKAEGEVVDGMLEITCYPGLAVASARSGLPEASHGSIPLNGNVSIENETSPRGFMPPLRLHQSWKVRQYSLLRLPASSLMPNEEVEATVERQETVRWNGGHEDCWLVVYRHDAGFGSESADKPLGRMWVRTRDGMVLKQEMALLDTPLRFVRLPAAQAAKLSNLLEQDRTTRAGGRRKQTIDSQRKPPLPAP